MSTLIEDIRFAIRMIWKHPGFHFVALLALTLGIGANTAVFSVINATLIKPLPYPEPNEVMLLQSFNEKTGQLSFRSSYADYQDWVESSKAFSSLAIFQEYDAFLRGDGPPEQVQVAWATPSLSSVLKLKPLHGRLLEENDHATAVLPYGLWQRRFGGAPDVLGETISLDGSLYTVVGVLPKGSGLSLSRSASGVGSANQILVPVSKKEMERLDFSRGLRIFAVVGRLNTGVTPEQAGAEMETLSDRLSEEHAKTNANLVARVIPLKAWLVKPFRFALLATYLTAGFLLLIACVNVANLLLARSGAREREVALRAAIGATRSRVVRQLLTESLVLGMLGGVFGLGAAWLFTELLTRVAPGVLGYVGDTNTDSTVLLFALGAGIVTSVVFGLIPALRLSRLELHSELKEGGRATSLGRGRKRTMSALVVGQIAVSLALLATAGATTQSFFEILGVDPGFNTSRSVHGKVVSPGGPNPGTTHLKLVEELGRMPGVDKVGAANKQLFDTLHALEVRLTVRGEPITEGSDAPTAHLWIVTREYSEAAGIPLKAGRLFSEQDDTTSPRVTILNQAAARQLFGDQDPIGKSIRVVRNHGRTNAWKEIVGVIGSVKHHGPTQPDTSILYVPYRQLQIPGGFTMSIVVRTQDDSPATVKRVVKKVSEVDPEVVMTHASTGAQLLSDQVAVQRFAMQLMLAFAGLATFLAGLGLYGILSYSVSQRRQEIGIRMAIGAQPGEIVLLILKQSLVVVLAGLALGLALSLVAMRLVASYLFEAGTTHWLTIGVSVVVLAGIAFCACLLPARRATKVDPLAVMR
jgi:putative ABC transport system permease protein